MDLCSKHKVTVTGVTKGACAHPDVAWAMLDGGVAGLADSRVANLARLRKAGIRAEMMLLRIPMPSETKSVVDVADISLNSEISTIRSLGEAAIKKGVIHKVILMVDTGDLREGVWPDDVVRTCAEIRKVPGVTLEGIGTNLGCYGGVIPTETNLGQLVHLKTQVEEATGRRLRLVSAGTSATFNLLQEGKLPEGINHFRVGEAILLGTEAVSGRVLPGATSDCFRLVAEVVEVKTKPSLPIGEVGWDAFRTVPRFVDRGIRKRAILSIGRQDIRPEAMEPLLAGCEILGASSDHLIVDVTDCPTEVRVGDEMPFRIGYGALLQAMTSEYVEKVVL